MPTKQRPEALAQFAETARTKRREERPGLVADEGTAPIPTDSKAKDDAGTKVLQEGVTGAMAPKKPSTSFPTASSKAAAALPLMNSDFVQYKELFGAAARLLFVL